MSAGLKVKIYGRPTTELTYFWPIVMITFHIRQCKFDPATD